MTVAYRDVIMSHWGSGRVGVIGDAAQAISEILPSVTSTMHAFRIP